MLVRLVIKWPVNKNNNIQDQIVLILLIFRTRNHKVFVFRENLFVVVYNILRKQKLLLLSINLVDLVQQAKSLYLHSSQHLQDSPKNWHERNNRFFLEYTLKSFAHFVFVICYYWKRRWRFKIVRSEPLLM